MTWILIFVLGGSFAGVSNSVEFSSQAKCEVARDKILKEAPGAQQFVYCFKK